MAVVGMLSNLTETGVKTNITLLLSREEFEVVETALNYASECAVGDGCCDMASRFATVSLDLIAQVNQIIKSVKD